MKIIVAPKVYLISFPSVDRGEIENFLEDNGFSIKFAYEHDLPAEQLSATASRTCYQSFDNGRSPDAHIKHLVAVGHGSVFAHASFSLLCTGISRSLTHELIRHHVGTAVSQLSQRFVDDPDEINFVVPPKLLALDGKGFIAPLIAYDYRIECENTIKEYNRLLNYCRDFGLPKKQAAETARCKLTNDVETRCVFTGNLRAWRNVWEQRCSPDADAEIRRFACITFDKLYPHCSTILSDYTKHPLPDGTFALTTEHRKI